VKRSMERLNPGAGTLQQLSPGISTRLCSPSRFGRTLTSTRRSICSSDLRYSTRLRHREQKSQEVSELIVHLLGFVVACAHKHLQHVVRRTGLPSMPLCG